MQAVGQELGRPHVGVPVPVPTAYTHLSECTHRVVMRRQIGLRSKQRQDISHDLQPSEQLLGMLLIIRDPCRCLDPVESLVHAYLLYVYLLACLLL